MLHKSRKKVDIDGKIRGWMDDLNRNTGLYMLADDQPTDKPIIEYMSKNGFYTYVCEMDRFLCDFKLVAYCKGKVCTLLEGDDGELTLSS